jgi:hypothetical protein
VDEAGMLGSRKLARLLGYFLQLILVGDINRADYLAGLGALLDAHPGSVSMPGSS